MLYVVATPIGNLKDITFRAVETLEKVDAVLAEDTRTAYKLLSHFNIRKPTLSYNDKNKKPRTEEAIKRIQQGQELALVSENGTPLISDPGFHLVRECIRNSIRVIPVPGPSACTAALMAAGMPTHQFCFVGFLPKGPGKREKLLRQLICEKRTIVAYESPHRINKTLNQLSSIAPGAEVAVCRELTKLHEEIVRAKAADIKLDNPRGEIVLLISPL
jgi:16S rRNA (cytidine1402-2'-O)-methyltransferase